MTNQSEDKNPRTTDSCYSSQGQGLRVRPEQMTRPAASTSRKRPLTPDQVEAWVKSKALQPPK